MYFKLKLIPIKNAIFFNREIIHRCTQEHTHLIAVIKVNSLITLDGTQYNVTSLRCLRTKTLFKYKIHRQQQKTCCMVAATLQLYNVF